MDFAVIYSYVGFQDLCSKNSENLQNIHEKAKIEESVTNKVLILYWKVTFKPVYWKQSFFLTKIDFWSLTKKEENFSLFTFFVKLSL